MEMMTPEEPLVVYIIGASRFAQREDKIIYGIILLIRRILVMRSSNLNDTANGMYSECIEYTSTRRCWSLKTCVPGAILSTAGTGEGLGSGHSQPPPPNGADGG